MIHATPFLFSPLPPLINIVGWRGYGNPPGRRVFYDNMETEDGIPVADPLVRLVHNGKTVKLAVQLRDLLLHSLEQCLEFPFLEGPFLPEL